MVRPPGIVSSVFVSSVTGEAGVFLAMVPMCQRPHRQRLNREVSQGMRRCQPTIVFLEEIALEQRFSVDESGEPECCSGSAGILETEVLDSRDLESIDPPHGP